MTTTSMRFSLATTVAIDSLSPQMLAFFISRQVLFSHRVYPDLAEEGESSESSESMRSGSAYHYSHHNGLQHSDNTFVLSLSSQHVFYFAESHIINAISMSVNHISSMCTIYSETSVPETKSLPRWRRDSHSTSMERLR